MKVRPELERMLQEAGEFFMPMVPLELQAQIRLDYELAKLREKLAEKGIEPASAQGEGGGTEASNPAGRSGEEISGLGPGSSSGPAGSPEQRPL